MPTLSSRVSAFVLFAAVTLPLVSTNPAIANGKTGPSELAKYMNPFQKKGYLNQSQDRVIKKKSFKVDQMPTAQAVTNGELGFFAIVPKDKLTDMGAVDQILSNDKVNGISVALPWSMIEPTEDNFQWQSVDQLLAACQAHGKTMILRITTSGTDLQGADKQATSDTPKWVFDSGVKSVSYRGADGATHAMPIPWDKDYLAKWSNFVGEMAERYDKNPTIHSIGITGGGFGVGTPIVPPASEASTVDAKGGDLAATLKQDFGMNQRQLVEHWKYVADLFPKRFSTARLNFNVNGPLHGRAGEDALDEIGDYLVYRYGERVYITRSGIKDGKHGFDDYRLLLKFHHDTLTGLRLDNDVNLQELPKIAKHALDDGISFAELPLNVVNTTDSAAQQALTTLAGHIGYQLINQKAQVSNRVAPGQTLKASFEFINAGAATAMRPERNMDKDTAMSYRVQVELRDAQGHPVLQNLHTPPVSTSQWEPGKPIAWEQDLKIVDANKHQLPAGEYSVWFSLVDPAQKKKIQFLQATSDGKLTSANTAEIGKLTITASVADTKTTEASSQENR